MSDINEKSNSTIPAFDANIKSLFKDWHVLKNVTKSWNIRDSIQIAEKMEPLTEELKENWKSLQSETTLVFDEIKQNLNSPEFILSLEKAIKELNVPLTGEFPNYELPPFKLAISLENYENRIYEQRIYNYMASKMEMASDMGSYNFRDNFLKADGILDFEKVLLKFQEFMKKENSKKDEALKLSHTPKPE